MVFPPVLPGPFVPLLHQPRTTGLARCPCGLAWSGPEHARSHDFRIITHWPQRELIPVRVAGKHGGACSISDGPRVRGSKAQNAKYGLANGPAAVGTAADIEAGGTVGTGNGVPSVVRVGAQVEVLCRGAERFVAPVPDDEPSRDGAMLQSPRVAVRGRRDDGVTASSLKTAVAPRCGPLRRQWRRATSGGLGRRPARISRGNARRWPDPPAIQLRRRPAGCSMAGRTTAVIQRASVRRPRRPLALHGLTERPSRDLAGVRAKPAMGGREGCRAG